MPKTYQPLHPSVRSSLDPQYVAIHDQYLQYVQPINEIEWHPSLRDRGMGFVSQSQARPIASIKDYKLENCSVRVYTPATNRPKQGWPATIWYHGGGWVTGSIASDASFCTQLAEGASCLVISVDYRLAPEHVYPAAIQDALDAFHWVYTQGASILDIDLGRVGIAGLSAGGGLAASVALSAFPLRLAFQVLIVPVIDNTQSELWLERPHAPYLSGPRMHWFRRQYFGQDTGPDDWKASPSSASEEMLNSVKDIPTKVVVADHDILASEGQAYAKLLEHHGCNVSLDIVKAATHSILLLDAVIDASAQLRKTLVEWIRQRL